MDEHHYCPGCLGEFLGERTPDILEACVGRIPEQHMWIILDAAKAAHERGVMDVLNTHN